MGFLDFLNTNSGAFSVLFSLLVTAATIFYAILTRRLVQETTQMREAQTEPSVVVRIEPHEYHLNLVMLVIENAGSGAAFDVRLKADPDFRVESKTPLSSLGFFKHGFRYLAPRYKTQTYLINLIGKGDEIEKGDTLRFDVTVSYKAASGRRYEHVYPIDFLHLVGVLGVGTPPPAEIASSLKKIAESVAQWERGWKRLKVETFNSGDRAREQQEWEDQREEHERQAVAAFKAVGQTAIATPLLVPSNDAALASTEKSGNNNSPSETETIDGERG